jgi:hypothetical protein
MGVHLRARFPPTIWRPPRGRIQDRMARTRSAGAEATTAQASTPPLAPEPANPSASVVQPSAGTGAGMSIPEVEHTASGVFEVNLEGLGASTQDIDALRRIQALIAGKAAAGQQEQEARPSSSQAQPSQQQGAAPTHAAPDGVDFNIRQAERYLALLQGQISARCHSNKSSLRQPLQHQQPPRRPRRHLSSTSGTPCRPCKLSWISGGNRRMRPKGTTSVIDRTRAWAGALRAR